MPGLGRGNGLGLWSSVQELLAQLACHSQLPWAVFQELRSPEILPDTAVDLVGCRNLPQSEDIPGLANFRSYHLAASLVVLASYLLAEV